MQITPAQRVAAEVRAEMARQNKSQHDLTEALGRRRMYFSRRLNGDVAFGIDELYQIAGWLGVDVLDLIPRAIAA